MKIIYKKGNLLDTDIKVIVHGCNAQGVMGAGIAKQIALKFPNAYKVYRKAYLENTLDLGSVHWADCTSHIIGNAITQEYYGRGSIQVQYIHIKEAMFEVEQVLSVEGYDKVALPKIGAGLGGGNWSIIENIIEKTFVNVQPYVYEL